MFGKGRGVDQANPLTDGFGFGDGGLPPSTAAKAARVMIKIIIRIQGAKIIGAFKSVYAAKLCSARLLPIISRPSAQGPAGRALFVRMVQNIHMLIGFFILARGIIGGNPIAIALGIKRGHINLGLSFNHHLRQIIPRAAGRGDAKGKPFRQPHISQPGRRAHQRVSVGRVTNRSVKIIFQSDGFC